MRRILILQGHPDSSSPHLCHALAERYRQGAEAAKRSELRRSGCLTTANLHPGLEKVRGSRSND